MQQNWPGVAWDGRERERERAERDILSLEFWLNNGARDVCACTSANAYARAVWTFGLDQRFSNCKYGKRHEGNFSALIKSLYEFIHFHCWSTDMNNGSLEFINIHANNI